MKITKAQILQIIKEEAQKVKKEVILKRELAAIENELQSLDEMVRTGGQMAPGTDGVHAGQKTPVYDGKPGFPNLKMEKEEEPVDDSAGDSVMISPSSDDEMAPVDGAGEMGGEMGGEMDGDMLTKQEILDAIKSLGAQLNLTGMVDFDATDETGDEMGDGMGVDIETGADDAAGAGTDMEAGTEVPTDDAPAEEAPSDETPEDDQKIDEAPVAQEGKKEEECNTTMEGEQVQKLQEEKNRWAKLAGIIKS